MIQSLVQDAQYALRRLAKSPGFTAVAVVTLALAIGANTAIFSVVYGVLLKPLPYDRPEQLITLWQQRLDGSASFLQMAPGTFADLRERARSFQAISGWLIGSWQISIGDEPEMFSGAMCIGSPFEVLEARPLLGRTFTSAEADREEQVIVLSHRAWQRLLGGDPAAIGRPLRIEDFTFTVIGVMPPDFRFRNSAAEFWMPFPWWVLDPVGSGLLEGATSLRTSRVHDIITADARLEDGTSLAAAKAEMETLMAELRREHPDALGEVGLQVVTLHTLLTGAIAGRLKLMMAAVGLVLAIGCVNLANLLLSQATARREEIALRQSLGAGRGRLFRQLLTESVLLAVMGGLAGLGVGAVFLKLILRFFPWQLPRVEEVGLAGPVLAFTLAVTLVAGLLFGSLPALQLARRAPALALRRGAEGTRQRRFLLDALAIVELGLAMVLVVGGGLLLRSFGMLTRVDPGFRSPGLMTVRADVSEEMDTPEERLSFFEQTLERLAALPGVEAAATANFLPLAGFQPRIQFHLSHRPKPPGTAPDVVFFRVVSPEYFATMGMSLVRGRFLERADRRDGAPAVVINETLARQYLAGEDPLAATVVLGPRSQPQTPPSAIVGVVRDERNQTLAQEPGAIVYVPLAVIPSWDTATFIVRASGRPEDLVPSLRQAIRSLDSAVPITSVQTMDSILDQDLAPARSATLLLGLLSGVALAMAGCGVFGVISYSVSSRLREFGIRMALGANRRRVLFEVLRRGWTVAVIGLVLGVGGALASGRFLESQLFGITARDPATLAAVGGLLWTIATLAIYLPARRATQLDPVEVLRYE